MYAELKRMCPICGKQHTDKTKWCAPCLKTRKRYRDKHPEKILGTKLQHKYGISLEEYNIMLANQNKVCMICGKVNNRMNYKTGLPERLVVDHDHSTKQVRGLLCHRCNLAVGIYETTGLQLAEYVTKFKKVG